MKGFLSLLLGSMIAVFVLFTPGNAAYAADAVGPETNHCGCEVTYLTGAERNKIVSNLLKSDEFKSLKKDLIQDGYKWKGAGAIEVIQNHTYGGIILVGVPFIDNAGTEWFFVHLYEEGTFTYLGYTQDL